MTCLVTSFSSVTLSDIEYKLWTAPVTQDFSGLWVQSPDCGYTIDEIICFDDESGNLITHEASNTFSVEDPDDANYAANKGKLTI